MAGGLCGFQQFDGPIPVNKNLWTLSFVCLLGGWGFLVLGGLYTCIDRFKLWDGGPFRIVGMNSILIYLLHELLEGQVPFCGDGCSQAEDDSHTTRMAMQLGGVTTWIIYSYYCYRKRFFLVV